MTLPDSIPADLDVGRYIEEARTTCATWGFSARLYGAQKPAMPSSRSTERVKE